MTKILAITRACRFSPNSVQKDLAIIETVAGRLSCLGHEVRIACEESLDGLDDCEVILTMGRMPATLSALAVKEKEGVIVLNSPQGVASCARSNVDRIMRENSIPSAPLSGNDGYWIKRGDEAAQSQDDVVFAKNDEQKENALQAFAERGVTDVVVTAHVKGDVLKFYGVRGTGFFKTYYPLEDGDTKFGNENINGPVRHYMFSMQDLHGCAEKTAKLTHTDIYGGDCIITPDGTFAIIDFNDWPSFSRCRDEAAAAIVQLVEKRIRK